METITPAELARELNYVDADGTLRLAAIASLLREAMMRWGLAPRRALLKHARDQLTAAELPTEQATEVLDRLIEMGECVDVVIGHERYVAPADRRWIGVGGGEAVLLGPVLPPPETPLVPDLPGEHLAQRVRMGSDDGIDLESRGVAKVSMAEWLEPLAFERHACRRMGEPLRLDQFDLAAFWDQLALAVGEDGLPLGPDAELRVVAGEPGAFFGRLRAPAPEGRWTDAPPEGLWCGYRRGHGEERWLPALISADESHRRALDLFDEDEWRGSLLARSRAIGPPEVAHRVGDDYRVTWPLPAQLRAAMDIIGVPTGPWRWRVAEDAPDPLDSIR